MWARNKLTVKERFEDVFSFESLQIEQTLDTEPPSCVYDAAIVMAKFIEFNFGASALEGKTALELGAGCGFTACQVAKQTSQAAEPLKIIATDVESVVPLIGRNIERNGLAGQVTAAPLFWGNQEHLQAVMGLAPRIDIVYGADILFDFDNFDGLFDIFDKVNAGVAGQAILVGFTHRFSDVERWFAEGIAAKGFSIEKAAREEFHPDFTPEPFESMTILKLRRGD